jgi:ribosome-associated protein
LASAAVVTIPVTIPAAARAQIHRKAVKILTGVAEHIRITDRVSIPLDEIVLRTSRSSGPGGQHANVTASRVEAVFDVDASESLSEAQKRRIAERLGHRVTATAQDSRSQTRNRALALERLAARLAGALAVRKRRRPTKPSAGARKRVRKAKERQSERKQQRKRPDTD